MEHYYTPEPTSTIVEHTFTAHARGQELSFVTATGLFSQKQIDVGSQLLIDEGIVKEGWRILDLGCAYGAVGIALKAAVPSLTVTFTDVNTRALEYVKKNLRANRINKENVELVSGNGFSSVTGLFDAIYLNPPQSAGKELCFSLIATSLDFLKPGGNLQIVARKNKGGSSLAEHMKSIFGNVDAVAKQSGFWVYISYKNE